MKIGLRTVKTAISAALAMIIAEKLGLLCRDYFSFKCY